MQLSMRKKTIFFLNIILLTGFLTTCQFTPKVNIEDYANISLIESIRQNYEVYIIKEIINRDLHLVNEPDQQGVYPVFYALYHDQPTKVLQLLIDHGAEIDVSVGDNNLTGILIQGSLFEVVLLELNGALYGDDGPNVLEVLINAGVDLNQEIDINKYPLHYVITNYEFVKLFIESGAEIHIEGVRLDFLQYAISEESELRIIRLLLEAGAKPDHLLYSIADYHQNIELIKELVEFGFDIKTYGYLVIENAVSRKTDLEFIRIVLEYDIDTSRNGDIFSELIYHPTNIALLELLVQAGFDGFDINGTDYNGYTPLMIAIRHNDMEIFQKLLQFGSLNINQPDECELKQNMASGMVALMYAINQDRLEMVKMLLERGADPNFRTAYDRLPLTFAGDQSIEIINVLLDAGADPNDYITGGYTALHTAALVSTDPAVIKVYVDAGAELECIDENGNTPLLRALKYSKYQDIMKILIELGSDVRHTNLSGENALSIARSRGFNELAALIQLQNPDYPQKYQSIDDMRVDIFYGKFPVLGRLWTAAEIMMADTGYRISWLSQEEKNMILYLNLARLDGQKFSESILDYYLDMYKIDNAAFTELYNGLSKVKNLPLLKPNQALYESAHYHALDMGATGNEGFNSTDGTIFIDRLVRFLGNIGGYSIEDLGNGIVVITFTMSESGRKALVFESQFYGDPRFYTQRYIALDIIMSQIFGESDTIKFIEEPFFSTNYLEIGLSLEEHIKTGFVCIIDFKGYIEE